MVELRATVVTRVAESTRGALFLMCSPTSSAFRFEETFVRADCGRAALEVAFSFLSPGLGLAVEAAVVDGFDGGGACPGSIEERMELRSCARVRE